MMETQALQLTQDWLHETQEEHMLKLSVNGRTIDVTWEKNDAVAALQTLVSDAPLTVQTSAYGGFEQVGALGASLPQSDSRITAQSGDILLYQGNQIVLFYGSNTWEYTRLGKIEHLSEQELSTLLSGGEATITIF